MAMSGMAKPSRRIIGGEEACATRACGARQGGAAAPTSGMAKPSRRIIGGEES